MMSKFTDPPVFWEWVWDRRWLMRMIVTVGLIMSVVASLVRLLGDIVGRWLGGVVILVDGDEGGFVG